MLTQLKNRQAEVEIRNFIGERIAAIEAKQLDRLIAGYLPSAMVSRLGRQAATGSAREVWEHALEKFPTQSIGELRDLHVRVSGDLALVECALHFVRLGGKAVCVRSTMVCELSAGRWQIAHEELTLVRLGGGRRVRRELALAS